MRLRALLTATPFIKGSNEYIKIQRKRFREDYDFFRIYPNAKNNVLVRRVLN